MVEMAAIGFALAFTPEHLWDPLTGRQRDQVVEWLRGVEREEPAQNNWQFFRLLVQMGLERVGVAIDREAQARSIELIDSFAVDDGWYTDGAAGTSTTTCRSRCTPTAWSSRRPGSATATPPRATSSARDGSRRSSCTGSRRDGGAVPFGRSLTYRMAQGSFWGALALADVDALDWAEVRGSRCGTSAGGANDRSATATACCRSVTATTTAGWPSPTTRPGSPYWCMKAFTMLAAPDDHPFWTVAEAAPPAGRDRHAAHSRHGARARRRPGGRADGAAAGLVVRGAEPTAKYHKFAYSSRFGFSGDFTMYGLGATDSMLAVTDPATGVRRVREGVVLSEVADGVALTRWTPMPGVRIDTALSGGAPWHVRVHRISTDRELSLSETGFALPWEPEGFAPPAPEMPERGRAVVTSPWGGSTLVDLRGDDRPARDAAVSVVESQRQHHVAAHHGACARDDSAGR